MINRSIDQFWNNINIEDQVSGSYAMLFGYADRGPSMMPVFAKNVDHVEAVFGPNSQLLLEYRGYIENGGDNVWLVRLNGSHVLYNINNCFLLTTLSGLMNEQRFDYRIWNNEQHQFITIDYGDSLYTYNISDTTIQAFCEMINGLAILGEVPFYTTFKNEGVLEDYVSSDEDKDYLIEGMMDETPENFIKTFEDGAQALIEAYNPNAVGFCEISITDSGYFYYDVFRYLNSLLNDKMTNFAQNIPVLCVMPIIGTEDEILVRSNNLIEYIKENPASINVHTETFPMYLAESTTRIKYPPVIEEEYDIFILEPDGFASRNIDGVCTFDPNYGIMEIASSTEEGRTLNIEYHTAGIDLYKLFCVVAAPPRDPASLEPYVTGVGALMGTILSTGLDGTVRGRNIVDVPLLDFNDLEKDALKRNGIIYTQARAIANTTQLRYANDKTLYSALSPNNPIVETININLIRSIVMDLSNNLEQAFTPGRIIEIDLVMASVMERYRDYVQHYTYDYEEITEHYFTKSYNIGIDLYINGVLTVLRLGFSL